ncbi:MAG: hypothetical protein HZA50_04855 [Planctomycetes bacterium]|nr:hypothetical protein [Planctomycetota bacterium]
MANFQVERLKQLSQRASETWQGGLVRLPGWIEEGRDKPFRLVGSMWGSLQTGKLDLGEEPKPQDESTFAMAVNALVNFATGPKAGYRPGKLEVNNPALAEHLSGLLADTNIRVEYRPRLLMIDRYMEEMVKLVFKDLPIPPPYLQGKDITVERVRAFAEAAAIFHKAAPWQFFGGEDLLGIESPLVDALLRFAVVMGAGGYERGLGFYKSTDHFWTTYDSDDSITDVLSYSGGLWSLTFDDVTEIPFGDSDLWEDHGLPVAGEDAYPVAMHVDSSMRMRRPGADVLNFMEGLMRALAETTEDELDSGRWTRRVATFNGPVDYILSLPFLSKPPARREITPHGMGDMRAMESMHAQINRFLDGKEFKNAGEMNAAIKKEFVGKPMEGSKYRPRNAEEEAQDMCFQAFDAVGRRRIILAKKALAIFPDCADAYVILAENITSPQKAEELYAAGVEAGRRTLGEKFFQQNAGHFWGMNRTRPFMRALEGLAEVRVHAGKLDQGAENFRELLRLNPHDNQGIRYLLLPLLIELGKLDESDELIAGYANDGMAVWKYCRALLKFRREADSSAARKLLQQAISSNPHAPKYLLEEAQPEYEPTGYNPGSEEEAIICAKECGRAWLAVSGALDWLKAQSAAPAEQPKKSPKKKTR